MLVVCPIKDDRFSCTHRVIAIQDRPNIGGTGPMLDQRHLGAFRWVTRHPRNVGPMFGQRLRCWPNIGPTLCGCLLFSPPIKACPHAWIIHSLLGLSAEATLMDAEARARTRKPDSWNNGFIPVDLYKARGIPHAAKSAFKTDLSSWVIGPVLNATLSCPTPHSLITIRDIHRNNEWGGKKCQV